MSESIIATFPSTAPYSFAQSASFNWIHFSVFIGSSASSRSTILSVAHGQPFARRANLALNDGAKVDVPAGVVLRVGELRVNGELLCGEFTSETRPDIVSGEGKVRTSGLGMILFVR